MADWRTLIKEDLSPPQARLQLRSSHRKPAHYKKIEWNDKTPEIQQQKLKIKRKLEKIDTVFSSHSKDITPEIATKAAKQQVSLKKKLVSLDQQTESEARSQRIVEKISEGNDKITEIKQEINRLDKFMTNPFSAPPNKRKLMWEEAAKKKRMLEKELYKLVKAVKELSNQLYTYERKRR